MFLRLGRVFSAALFMTIVAEAAPRPAAKVTLAIPAATSADLRSAIEVASQARTRDARVKALLKLRARVREKIEALPEEVADSELDSLEALYAYDLFLSSLSAETLDAKRCPATRRALKDLADPRGDGIDTSAEGGVVLGLVSGVCAR